MVGDDALTAVLAHAQAQVGMNLVEVVQPRTIVLHPAAIPAEIVVVADNVSDVVHGAFHRSHGHMGNGGQTCGVQFLGQSVELLVVFHQLLGNAANQNFIGDAPEADRGMVVVLDDKFLELADAILMGVRVLVEHADERYLRPYHKAQLIAGVVEVLRMLVVSQADGVSPKLFNDFGVQIVVLLGKSVTLIKLILVAADAPEGGLHSIDDKALARVTGEGAYTGLAGNLVISLIPA